MPNSVNVDKLNTLFNLLLRLFFVRAISCLKLNLAADLVRCGARSLVPSVITPNHSPMNRFLWIPVRKNDFDKKSVSNQLLKINLIWRVTERGK